MDVTYTNRRLQGSWSIASAITSSLLSSQGIDETRNNFNKFDKKVKLRLLLALLNVDINKNSDSIVPIKKILSQADDDEDEWITTVSGLVYSRIFSSSSDGSSDASSVTAGKYASRIDSACDRIVDGVSEYMSVIHDVNDGEAFYFQPYEMKYITDSSSSSSSVSSPSSSKSATTSHSHFLYVGKRPNFIAREEIEIKKQEEEHKKKIALMSKITNKSHAVMHNQQSVSSSSNRRDSNQIKPLMPMKAVKIGTQKVSIDQMNEKTAAATAAATTTASSSVVSGTVMIDDAFSSEIGNKRKLDGTNASSTIAATTAATSDDGDDTVGESRSKAIKRIRVVDDGDEEEATVVAGVDTAIAPTTGAQSAIYDELFGDEN